MATGQISVSRHRAHPTPKKPSRQAIPQFVQKLYELVNQPSTASLIHWSDAGDSFFILDQDRLAKEVLGRWFKHQNFSSFVRQLNMYGFHKIPHLQQGVLRSDTPTEFWNFAHPNFHRGQPEHLHLIRRKKGPPYTEDDGIIEMRDPKAPTTVPSTPNLSSGQILDIHSIVNGIAAIKRHQTTISTELNELKRSNQMLWQDAMDARAKHQKQQDTINRIVKFLAGVFGNRANPHKEDVEASIPSRAVVPRRRSHLMIEDGRRGNKVKVTQIEDEEDEGSDYDVPQMSISETPQYPTIETPQSIPSPTPSDQTSPLIIDASTYFGTYHPSPPPTLEPPTLQAPPNQIAEDSQSGLLPQTYDLQTQHPNPTPTNVNNMTDGAMTQSRSPTNYDFDPRIQAFLDRLTPPQIQQLLASIVPQGIDPLTSSSEPPPPPSSSQLTPYQPQFDFSQFMHSAAASPPSPQPPPIEGLISFDPQTHSAPSQSTAEPARIGDQWRATEDIERDVNSVSSHISSLVKHLGLDPQQLVGITPSTTELHPPGVEEVDASVLDVPSSIDDAAVQDFDFDSFLNGFDGNDSVDYADSASTAFLDEVPSPSDGAASPITHLQQQQLHLQHGGSPLQNLGGSGGGRKRKSDVSTLDSGLELGQGDPPVAKSPKRKRNQ